MGGSCRSTAAIVLFCLFAGLARGEPVTLIFAGDIMLADGPGRTIAAGGDPLAPFAGILDAADVRIANLECPVATGGQPHASKIATFRAEPQTLSVLRGRFDAVSLANNHSGDYGHAAFVETMGHLANAGIAHFGGGHDLAEAHRPLWIEKRGLKIAVLGYNEFKPRAFEAGADWPGVAWSEDDQVIADIRAARAAGAALVVGGHPHVTQGAEIHKGKPIVYSLGNFVFDGFDYPEAQRGWLLRVKLDKSGVIFWETLAAQIDDAGTPWSVPGAFTPCGRGDDDLVTECANP